MVNHSNPSGLLNKHKLKAEHEEFAGLLEEALEETAVKLAKEAEVKIDKVKKGTLRL